MTRGLFSYDGLMILGLLKRAQAQKREGAQAHT